MNSDPAIVVDNVSKKFCRSMRKSMRYGLSDVIRDLAGIPLAGHILRDDEFWAFRDLSFSANAGDCIGIIGANGAGKSSLLKLVAGILPPDTGSIRVNGRAGTLLEVGAGFHPSLTGRENIFVGGAIMGLSRRELNSRMDEIISFSGLEYFIDTPIKKYSSGMYVRLGFAVAAHTNPDVFLVDEALSVGDFEFRAKCLNRITEMRRNGTAVLFVSHSEHQVRAIANRCLLLNHGAGELYDDIDKALDRYHASVLCKDGDKPLDGQTNYNGKARILASKVDTGSGNGSLVPGNSLELRINIDAEHKLNEIYAIVNLWSQEGHLVAVFDSRDKNTYFNFSAGNHSIVLKLPEIPLAHGHYRLAGGFRTKDSEICAWSTDMARFSLESRKTGISKGGMLDLQADFYHEAPDAFTNYSDE